MTDLAINLLASVIVGVAVWVFQRVLDRRSAARRRAFYGVRRGAPCWVSIPKHAASPSSVSVHRRDMAAVVEVAALLRECGGQVRLDLGDRAERGVGVEVEFCLGGPTSNPRTAAHLRHFLPGVSVEVEPGDRVGGVTRVGTTAYAREAGRRDYVLVARVRPGAGPVPLWLICGQTARANEAAAGWLSGNASELAERHGRVGRFCELLCLVDSDTYGSGRLEWLADVTDAAFAPAPGGRADGPDS